MYEPQPSDILKRLASAHPDKLDWYYGINGHPYSDHIRHSFSNQAYRKEVLHQGTTHVAVGFVDLGLLLEGTLQEPPTNHSGPLHFVGVELSSYAVAKTMVVWEMLKQSPRDPAKKEDHMHFILQAWFSSTWSQGTARALNSAISALCTIKEKYHEEVQKLLRHWVGTASVSVANARREIAESTTDALSSIGHLLKKRDRIALAQYELTRDFAIHGQDGPACGNILMHSCPDGTPPVAHDETIFSAFNWFDILKILREKKTASLMKAAELWALDRITKVADWATSGMVSVELICAPIETVVPEIAARRPWTMSWSNLCDYIDLSDFHSMARDCSRNGDTIHYGYSMNWVLNVYGVFLLDYMGPHLSTLRGKLIEQANETVRQKNKAMEWSQYLRFPPPTNPINTTSHFLAMTHFRNWGDYFFGLARESGPCTVANIEHVGIGVSPLSTTGSNTVAFTWTYDPLVSFNALPES